MAGREARVRLMQEVSRFDIVQSGRLPAGLQCGCVSVVKVDRVCVEMMSSTGVVEVTVRTDDYAWTTVLVD